MADYYGDDAPANEGKMEEVVDPSDEAGGIVPSGADPDVGAAATDDDAADRTAFKLLLNNAAAGSIIGKGGETITGIQTQSKARLQLSRSREFFPGTNERILLVSGTINECLAALHLIVTKLLDEEGTNVQVPQGVQVRIVLPNAGCGAVIGKGGATIRTFTEDSGAQIKLSDKDLAFPGVSDRVVAVLGAMEQVLRAVALIVQKANEDPSYQSFGKEVYTYSGAAGPAGLAAMAGAGMPMAPAAPMAMMGAPPPGAAGLVMPHSAAQTTVTVAVPDAHIGAIVGRGGKTIGEIQAMSGVRIKISDRSDYVPGSTNRKVTMIGSDRGCQMAQYMITQKVAENAQQMASRRGPAGGDATIDDAADIPVIGE